MLANLFDLLLVFGLSNSQPTELKFTG